MKTKTLDTRNTSNTLKALGLMLATLAPATALADGRYHHGHRDRGVEVGGTVVVSKEIPGGVITVGATIGRPQPTVVHEKVVVVKERAPEKVVIIEREPVREKVVIIKERPVEKKVVIIEKHGRHGKHVKKIVTVERGHGHYGRGHGRDWDDDRGHGRHGRHGRHDWYDRHDRGDRDWNRGHGHSHAQQVSIQKQGPDGNYHYYEDAHQVSIQDNRGGQNRHVYVRK